MIPIAKPEITDEEIQAVTDVLESGNIASGKRVLNFEEKFAKYIGVKHAIACSNGTSALHTALLAHGVGVGDEVIVPSFSFIATATAVSMCGAYPIFADVHPTLYGIDVGDVKRKINSRTKAVIGVHLYGLPCHALSLRNICDNNNIAFIEDSAQAVGAAIGNVKCGSFGDSGCFSFYATKNMTTGEGGMITTNDDNVADAARMIINHGQRMKYVHERLGYNYRMTDIVAAIGVNQLNRIERLNNMRRMISRIYGEEIEVDGTLILPYEPPNMYHVYHQYVMQLSNAFPMRRDLFIDYLSKKGIGSAVHYPIPIHKQPLYNERFISLKVSESLAKNVVSIPIHPSMSVDDVSTVVDAINNVVRQ
jgi:perosamine synthetase